MEASELKRRSASDLERRRVAEAEETHEAVPLEGFDVRDAPAAGESVITKQIRLADDGEPLDDEDADLPPPPPRISRGPPLPKKVRACAPRGPRRRTLMRAQALAMTLFLLLVGVVFSFTGLGLFFDKGLSEVRALRAARAFRAAPLTRPGRRCRSSSSAASPSVRARTAR
jgi:hypothetical protein